MTDPTPWIAAEQGETVRKHAPATLRNRDAIEQVLGEVLPVRGDVLEIASGSGEHCASTSNRNFEGRQGAGGRTHLVSPAMAAAAAVTGHFIDVRELLQA